MNKAFHINFFVLIALLLSATAAFAHQPRIPGNERAISVRSPEVSKAYYSELKGSPVKYIIRSKSPFHLYVNILVPDIKGIKKNASVKIMKNGKTIAVLNGMSFKWKAFYEEFGGDNYFAGPEYSKNVGVGNYELRVYNPGNKGKYVLAVGEKEDFTPKEMIKAIIIMPKLKVYFGKAPYTAYFNRIGLFMLPVVIILLLFVMMAIRSISKRRRNILDIKV